MPRKWTDREEQMLVQTLGTLMGRVDKKAKAPAGGAQSKPAHVEKFHNREKLLPKVKPPQWYCKADLVGLPGYSQQKGRGTPRVVLLVEGDTPTGQAWTTLGHYDKFELLDDALLKKAQPLRKAVGGS